MTPFQQFMTRLLNLGEKANGKPEVPMIASSAAGRPQWNDWSTETAIRDGLKASVWVYASVRKLAAATASVPWRVERLKGKEWEPIDGHPLETLLDKPNPYTSGSDLLERATFHLLLGGNAVWHVVRARGAPVELWPLMPDRVRPIPAKRGWLDGYEYKIGSDKLTLKPEEVVHLQLADPSNPFWGLAPLQAAAKTVDTDIEAVRWNKVSLANRAVKDMAMFPAQALSADQWTLLRSQISLQHTGPSGARGILLMSTPGDLKELNATPVEMDFMASRKFHREEIAAVFGLSPLLIGGAEGTTFANLDTAKRMMWEDTIVPFLRDIADAINLTLAPAFGPAVRVAPDLTGVTALQENLGERAKTAQLLVQTGWPLNAVNKRLELGFDDVEGGDEPKQPAVPPPEPVGEGEAPIAQAAAPRPARRKTLDLAEDAKAAWWKARDTTRTEWEAQITKRVITTLEAEGEAVATAYASGSLRSALGAVDEAAWTALLKASYTVIAEHYAQTEGESLEREGAKASKRFAFTSTRRLREWIARNTAEMVRAIVQTTRDAIKATVADALANDEGTPEIARRLLGLYRHWASPEDSAITVPRAYLIARTEVGRAASFGTWEGARQASEELGITIERTWITSRDDRVRDEHQALDGETVGLDEAFSNGRHYPDEPNCRCDVQQHVRRT